MNVEPTPVIGGIDTHTDFHQLAVIDTVGRQLDTKAFPTTPDGYRHLLRWMRTHGEVLVVGMESTGHYGAELACFLYTHGVQVVEVDRPDKRTRRVYGKTDPLDAYSAAAAVLSGHAKGTPKSHNGIVESIRVLRTARISAIKARTQAINQIHALIIPAPSEIRENVRGLTTHKLITALARTRPTGDPADPVHATRTTLRRLARRYLALNEEIKETEAEIKPLVTRAAPTLVAQPGIGPETAGQLLISAGDNPQRLRTEASFARLCGVAPIPASSGRTDRHPLHRGGDRQANKALHAIVMVRMKYDARTQDYVTRRIAEGLSKRDIIRCLKRFVAREVYHRLPQFSWHPEQLLQTA
ncbi:IS110 family transposase [Streptomyces sp. CC224B]|uniref:IS110 family transposase n=1 Tax=Streptomyces sp. CC224B TaxID=3044571 RepID=UPI0024A912AC|nr:IS110 family transposase [Streptomyces sp. CC224B]